MTYEQLLDKGGTIYNTETNQPYGKNMTTEQAHAQLATDLNMRPDQIDWTKIPKEQNTPALITTDGVRDLTQKNQDELNQLTTPVAATKTTETTPVAKTTADNQQLNDINAGLDEDLQTANSLLQSQIDKMDARTAQLITTIQSSFNRRRDQQSAINKQMLAGTGVRGYTTGRARYAPDLQASIMTTEERAGVARLADLDAQEADLINKAQTANEDKDFEALNKMMDNIRQNKQDKRQAILDIQKLSNDQERMLMDKAQAAREEIKFNLEQQDNLATDLSQLALNSTTGDSKTDAAYIKSIADEYGIDPNILLGKVANLQAKLETDLMTTDLKEYRYDVSQGYEGTFKDWQKENKGEQLVSGGGGSQWRLNDKTGKYEMVVPPVFSPSSSGADKKDLNTTLYNVGLPQTIIDSKGNLNNSQLSKLGDKGIPPTDAQEIMDEIVSGKSLDEVRQWMRANGVDPSILDTFMQTLQGETTQIINPFK